MKCNCRHDSFFFLPLSLAVAPHCSLIYSINISRHALDDSRTLSFSLKNDDDNSMFSRDWNYWLMSNRTRSVYTGKPKRPLRKMRRCLRVSISPLRLFHYPSPNLPTWKVPELYFDQHHHHHRDIKSTRIIQSREIAKLHRSSSRGRLSTIKYIIQFTINWFMAL